jgi:hypothetical protein
MCGISKQYFSCKVTAMHVWAKLCVSIYRLFSEEEEGRVTKRRGVVGGRKGCLCMLVAINLYICWCLKYVYEEEKACLCVYMVCAVLSSTYITILLSILLLFMLSPNIFEHVCNYIISCAIYLNMRDQCEKIQYSCLSLAVVWRKCLYILLYIYFPSCSVKPDGEESFTKTMCAT